VFDESDALHGEFLECHLAASSWRGAALEATVFRDCDLSGAAFSEAQCNRTQLLRCNTGLPNCVAPQARILFSDTTRESRASGKVAVATGHQNLVTG
jgi:Pentapeptide repeats (8 copies)